MISKDTISKFSILGNYIGTLRGILVWDLPKELTEVLEKEIIRLEKISEVWTEALKV